MRSCKRSLVAARGRFSVYDRARKSMMVPFQTDQRGWSSCSGLVKACSRGQIIVIQINWPGRRLPGVGLCLCV